jgi:hypothetical protein
MEKDEKDATIKLLLFFAKRLRNMYCPSRQGEPTNGE